MTTLATQQNLFQANAGKSTAVESGGVVGGSKKNLTHDCAIPPVTTIYERLLDDDSGGGGDVVIIIRPPRNAHFCAEQVPQKGDLNNFLLCQYQYILWPFHTFLRSIYFAFIDR